MKKFALIGAAGFIAPRHMRAIADTGNTLIAALDPSDSVGVLDQYFGDTNFFTSFERFDRFLEKQRREGQGIEFLSVCSPNHLHDAHIRFGLRHQADVICEKPLVLNPWNLDGLAQVSKDSGKKVFNLLQLREHAAVRALKKQIESSDQELVHDIDLVYITTRGKWYYTSWKAEEDKSGGIATNIGIHFFDMLQWIFGPVQENTVHVHTHDRAAGFLRFKKARVRWFLSINENTLPQTVRAEGKKVYRSIVVDGKEIGLNEGFDNLHTACYQSILAGKGYELMESKPAIDIAHQIRIATPSGLKGDYHPLATLALEPHPFKK